MAAAEKLASESQAEVENLTIKLVDAKTAVDQAQAAVDVHKDAEAVFQANSKELDRLDAEVKRLKARGNNAHAVESLAKLEAELAEKSQLSAAVDAFRAGMDKAAEAGVLVDKYEAEIAFYDVLQKAFSPAGIPTEMIAEALGPINILLAVAAAHLFPGRTLTLTPELNFVLEGAPLLSKSAELRVGVAIQYALAKLAGARLLMVDEVDMLDPENRKGFVKFLRAARPDFDTIMAFATAASSSPAPIPEVQVWFVDKGQVVAL
jgi:hypothetical protein